MPPEHICNPSCIVIFQRRKIPNFGDLPERLDNLTRPLGIKLVKRAPDEVPEGFVVGSSRIDWVVIEIHFDIEPAAAILAQIKQISGSVT